MKPQPKNQLQKKDLGKLYRQFSRQRYSKYRHQFPRWGQAKIVSTVIKDWQQMTPTDKVQLFNSFMGEKFIDDKSSSSERSLSPGSSLDQKQRKAIKKKKAIAKGMVRVGVRVYVRQSSDEKQGSDFERQDKFRGQNVPKRKNFEIDLSDGDSYFERVIIQKRGQTKLDKLRQFFGAHQFDVKFQSLYFDHMCQTLSEKNEILYRLCDLHVRYPSLIVVDKKQKSCSQDFKRYLSFYQIEAFQCHNINNLCAILWRMISGLDTGISKQDIQFFVQKELRTKHSPVLPLEIRFRSILTSFCFFLSQKIDVSLIKIPDSQTLKEIGKQFKQLSTQIMENGQRWIIRSQKVKVYPRQKHRLYVNRWTSNKLSKLTTKKLFQRRMHNLIRRMRKDQEMNSKISMLAHLNRDLIFLDQDKHRYLRPNVKFPVSFQYPQYQQGQRFVLLGKNAFDIRVSGSKREFWNQAKMTVIRRLHPNISDQEDQFLTVNLKKKASQYFKRASMKDDKKYHICGVRIGKNSKKHLRRCEICFQNQIYNASDSEVVEFEHKLTRDHRLKRDSNPNEKRQHPKSLKKKSIQQKMMKARSKLQVKKSQK